MRFYRTAAWSLFIGCVLTASCDSLIASSGDILADEELECLRQPIPGDLQPLAVGNRWDYQYTSAGSNDVRQYRLEIVDQIEIGPSTLDIAYEVHQIDLEDNRRVGSIEFWQSGPDGLSVLADLLDNDPRYEVAVTLPYPAEVGDVIDWRRYLVVPGENRRAYANSRPWTVLMDSYNTVVPLGSFLTIVFHSEHWPHVIGDWGERARYTQYAPGIGMIADDYALLNSDQARSDYRWELIDYCLMQ